MERYLPIKHPWVDSSLAPLYQVTFPAHTSDEKLLSYCRAVESWSNQVAYPVAWLMDLSRVEQVSAQQRAIFAKYMRSMEQFDRRCTKASALISTSALMRGVATAIFWLYPPLFLHRTFGESREGLAWLCEVLHEAGVEQLSGASGAPGPRASDSKRPSAPSSTWPAVGSDSAGLRERVSVPTTSYASSVPPKDRGSLRPNQR